MTVFLDDRHAILRTEEAAKLFVQSWALWAMLLGLAENLKKAVATHNQGQALEDEDLRKMQKESARVLGHDFAATTGK